MVASSRTPIRLDIFIMADISDVYCRSPKKVLKFLKKGREPINNRQAAIILTLLTQGQISKNQLQKEYNTTAKTIERDIVSVGNLLSDYLGLEVVHKKVVTDDKKRDVLYQVDATKGPFLTQREVFVVTKLLLASRSFDPTVVEKLITKLTRPLKQLRLDQNGSSAINALLKGERQYYQAVARPTKLTVLDAMINAVYAHKKVIVRYQKSNGEIDNNYLFTPLSIEHFDYYWYVRGYKEDNEASTRILRCDRVLDIKISEDATKHDLEGIEADRNTVIGMFKGQDHQTQTLIVKADYKAADLTIDRLNARVVAYYDGDQEVPTTALSEVPIGKPVKLITRLMAGAGLYLILGLSGVEVLAPASLRQQIKAELAQALDRYQDDEKPSN